MASTIEPATPVNEATWPRPLCAWYVVIVLAIASLLSGLDRSALNLLLLSIKKDFALSDSVCSSEARICSLPSPMRYSTYLGS